MNLSVISVLVISLLQAGTLTSWPLQLKSSAQFGWSTCSVCSPPRIAISWDGETGLPKEWDKEYFPFGPTCTSSQAEAAMNRVACDPMAEEGRLACLQRRTDAALRACGAVLPGGVIAKVTSVNNTGNYLFCRKVVLISGQTERRYGCKVCRAVKGKKVQCRAVSERRAIEWLNSKAVPVGNRPEVKK